VRVLRMGVELTKHDSDDARDGYARADDDILATASRDSDAAFSELYQRYLDPVFRYCFVRLQSRHAAEDVASEVFLRALAGIHSYRGGNFSAWLFRIAHNEVIRSYRVHANLPLSNAGDRADGAPTPDRDVEQQADRAELLRALAQLSEEQRTVIELQLAGWTGVEIAAATGKSSAAVKMLRYRAVVHLRTILTGHMHDQGDRM